MAKFEDYADNKAVVDARFDVEPTAQQIGETLQSLAENDDERGKALKQLGIHTIESLRKEVEREAQRKYVVENLFRAKSINVLVGDSGLGKTPLAVQIGICIAANVPLFGRAVEPGTVLYCDAESGASDFSEMASSISEKLGLTKAPSNFLTWSPNFDKTSRPDWGSHLIECVKELKPSFVVVDPLRCFWPEAEVKNRDATEFLNSLRVCRTTWLILHHCRKVNQQAPRPDLVQSPREWFQEAAGAHGLVNHVDTRLGVIPHPGRGDLLLGGFIRRTGPIAPLDISRALNDEGLPVAYDLMVGVELLSDNDKQAFQKLPGKFRHKDVFTQMDESGSNSERFIKKCLSLQLVRKEGKGYVKLLTDGGNGVAGGKDE